MTLVQCKYCDIPILEECRALALKLNKEFGTDMPCADYKAKGRCELLDCELTTELPLGELLKSDREDVKNQAKILLEQFGFKKDEILCEDCFWK